MKKYFSMILFFTVAIISSECIALENNSIMKRLAEQSEKINLIRKGDLSQCVNNKDCHNACKTCSGYCKYKV